MKIVIQEHQKEDAIPYHLLLIADPSQEAIDRYIFNSFIYKAYLHEQLVGCYVLYDVDPTTIELKNIVVVGRHEGQGIGTILLKDAIERLRASGKNKLIVGTGNLSIGPLHLYEKVGFKITGVKKNYFIENYPEPIFEDGIQCIDMIMLSKEL